MVWAFIAAALVLRPNNSLAGVLGSSGLASAGNGRGLRLPLSCASVGAPNADARSAAENKVFRGRRAIIMGTCLGLVSLSAAQQRLRTSNADAHPTPTHKQRQRTPNATPGEYVRLAHSQLRPVGRVFGRA